MDGIGWAAGAMSAAQTRLDVAAANLANGSTDGFRKTRVSGYLSAAAVVMRESVSDAEGPLRQTGRDLDLAIVGPGSFRVRDARGTIAPTRNGAFSRDRFGRLQDATGAYLMGEHGPVVLPAGARIATDGRILANGRTCARIPLPPGTQLRTGFLESSNVDAIGELVDSMTAQRSYECAEKVLTAIDSARERSAAEVAKVNG